MRELKDFIDFLIPSPELKMVLVIAFSGTFIVIAIGVAKHYFG